MQVPEFFFGILVFATKHGHDSEIRSIKHLGVTFVNVKLTMSIANILLLVEHAPGKKVTNSKYFKN